MGKTFKRIGLGMSAMALATMLWGCDTKSIYDNKQITTEPTSFSEELTVDQLVRMAETGFKNYELNSGYRNWKGARDALQDTLVAYNTIIDKYAGTEIAFRALEKVHSMKLGTNGNEVKLDALLQEGGPGSKIRIGMYEIDILKKSGGEDLDGKKSDNVVILSLKTNGMLNDLNWVPGRSTAEFNTRMDDIYLSDLIKLASQYD